MWPFEWIKRLKPRRKPSTRISDLPDEILEKIFTHLLELVEEEHRREYAKTVYCVPSFSDLWSARVVNRRFNRLMDGIVLRTRHVYKSNRMVTILVVLNKTTNELEFEPDRREKIVVNRMGLERLYRFISFRELTLVFVPDSPLFAAQMVEIMEYPKQLTFFRVKGLPVSRLDVFIRHGELHNNLMIRQALLSLSEWARAGGLNFTTTVPL